MCELVRIERRGAGWEDQSEDGLQAAVRRIEREAGARVIACTVVLERGGPGVRPPDYQVLFDLVVPGGHSVPLERSAIGRGPDQQSALDRAVEDAARTLRTLAPPPRREGP